MVLIKSIQHSKINQSTTAILNPNKPMKQIITILTLFVTISSFAQWSFNRKHDVFDGDYIVASASGRSGKYPYTNPTFVINQINDKYNMYVTGMGSTSCEEWYLKIKTNLNDNLYSFRLHDDADGDSVFLSFDDSDVSISIAIEMLEDFKKGSKAYFKWGTRCSTNQWEMSLSGSSNAIESTKIIEYLNSLLNKKRETKEDGEKFVENYFNWKNTIIADVNSLLGKYYVYPTLKNYDGDLTDHIVKKLFEQIHNENSKVHYYKSKKYTDKLITHFEVKEVNSKLDFYGTNDNGTIQKKITPLGWEVRKY